MSGRPVTIDAARRLVALAGTPNMSAVRAAVAALPDVRAEAPPFRIDGERGVITMSDPISATGDWAGVSAKDFITVLDQLGAVSEIEVRINSSGGSVFDGIAIYNALRAHPARIITRVEGLAASIASVIVQAGDERLIMGGAHLMIHRAWSPTVGNARDLRELADILERLDDSLADAYATRSGGTRQAWLARMDTESWYSADQALAAGLVDNVSDGTRSGDDTEGYLSPDQLLALLDL